MTDLELIQLLQETPPEDLSLEELDQLAERVRHSVPLRQALAEHLQLESLLGASLGGANVSLERIFSGSTQGRLRGNRLFTYWRWSLLGLLTLLVSGGWWAYRQTRDAPLPIVQRRPAGERARGKFEDARPAPTDDLSPRPPRRQPGRLNLASGDVNVDPPALEKDPNRRSEDFADDGPSPFEIVEAGGPAAVDSPPDQYLAAAGGSFEKLAEDSPSVRLRGRVRLTAPWRPETAIRLLLAEHHGLKIDVTGGQERLILQYSDVPRAGWAAYEASDDGKPGALLAADNDRYRRLGKGPVDLSYARGRLFVGRADAPVFSVAMAAPPDEVTFEGEATLHAATMAPFKPAAESTIARPQQRPGGLAWRRPLAGRADWRVLPDGTVELTADNPSQPVLAHVPTPEPGLQELLVEILQPAAGAGIYLGDRAGQPLCQVGFYRDNASGELRLGYRAPGDTRLAQDDGGSDGPTPRVGSRCWLRLVLGAGSLRCWMSREGTSWAEALPPWRQMSVAPGSAGIYLSPGPGTRGVALRHFSLRRLSALEALAPAALRDQALAITEARDLDGWLTAVLESRPPDVDSTDWWSACALRSLAAGAPSQLANALLHRLVDEALTVDRPPAERLRILAEAALVCDTWDPQGLAAFVEHYDRLGRILLRQGYRRPFTILRGGLLTAPIATPLFVDLLPPWMVRCELLDAACNEDVAATRQLCRQVKFFGTGAGLSSSDSSPRSPEREALLGLAEWVDAQTGAGGDAGPQSTGGQHPLAPEAGKEGYNILAEFQASLAAGAWRDACSVLAATDPERTEGLLPAADDDRLLVALSQAVESAMRAHPELLQTMQTDFSQSALLKLRQATEEDNSLAVRSVAVQFYGGLAACDAWRWLRDRELADGDFGMAAVHYAVAQRYASPELAKQLAARRRLAGAMLGRSVGEPIEHDVQLATGTLTGEAFEQLIGEMLLAHSSAGEDSSAAPHMAPIAAEYEAHPWASVDIGGPAPVPAAPAATADRDDEGIVGAVHGSRMLLSTAQQLMAFDLASGSRLWAAPFPAVEIPPGAPRPSLRPPPHPVGILDRVLIRRPTSGGVELAALDATTGAEIWRSAPGDRYVADPLWIDGQCLAPVVTRFEDDRLRLECVQLDPRSGAVLSRLPLATFHDVWQGDLPCLARAWTDGILLLAGGCTLSLDHRGHPLWLRKHVWIPPDIDGRSASQRSSLALEDGAVCTCQPGVAEIACLDLVDGRVRWQRVAPDVERLLTVSQGRLLVETSTGFEAFEATTGRPAWSRDIPHQKTGVLCGGPGSLVYTEQESPSPGVSWPAMVWLHPQTGRETARWPLEFWPYEQSAAGPLLSHDGRAWVVLGRDPRESPREIFRLSPRGATP